MKELKSELTVCLPEDVEMRFRLIVDGDDPKSFPMGARGHKSDEEPVHRVEIANTYYLAETPVTQAQYRVMAKKCEQQLDKLDGNKGIDPSYFKGENRPVEQVDWQDAECICKWLSSYIEADGWQARLPNEAEWEYACRAGNYDTDYWNGNGEAALAKIAWFAKDLTIGTREVYHKEERHPFGLYDMHGNIWEWCSDVYDPLAYAKRNNGWVAQPWTDADAGKGASNGGSNDGSSYRVLRGGSWRYSAWDCRSAFRIGFWAGFRHGIIGCRVCLVPGSGGQPNQDQPRKERVR